ncbi:MAG: CpaF/VirB11 family protein, partial [Actinomycetes bacterium]|nr:CpaF/VirB11 family protein [Actinomycetes bacterium]
RASLRMRPDRIILGEARGREIRDVLAALNTGHAGSWFTLHANSSADVPARLAALGALADMDEHAMAVQAAAALDAVVFLRRENGHRWVAELARLRAREGRLEVDVVLDSTGGRRRPEWEEFSARWSP